ncbi:hypothetical protein EGW08_023566 [Elysia chlorotica]|uniref:RNase H type-1 domain-containing protein n=1 Tax=Elysia chlorotica TaxID=188477 RepID=A0A3S1APZ9_ELYCH|nr:hypothetical protein EGW08_023566 [Elysia chlorotica]
MGHYGSIVYGSAKKHILKTLDPIHHQGLRIALGAFRTSPVQSLYAESGEPSLEHRRLKLSLNYAAKLNSIPENPGFESLTDSSPIEFFETKKSGPSLGARLQNHLEKIETKYENIDNVKVRKPPPWEQYNVKFDTSLTEFEKGNTNALVLQKEFLNLKEQYNEHYEIYTDGSKQDHKVAAAFFLLDDPGDSVSTRLRDYSSVFSAELEAILMAIKMVKSKLSRRKRHFAVFVDSLSALQALENRHFKNKNVRRIFNIIRTLPQRVSITFIWTPAHVGIKGNETVDQHAKDALSKRETKELDLVTLKRARRRWLRNSIESPTPGIIFVRKRNDKKRNNTFVLTCDSTSPPTCLKVGYSTFKVTPYIPRPMRCFKCHRFGHSRTTCRCTVVRCRCGKGGHAGKD